MKTKVIEVTGSEIIFEDGTRLYSNHEQSCCESHDLSMADLTLSDFEGLEFDLSTESFFERVDGYGIRLIPLVGHPVSIPGYGSNNGYYSSNLELVLQNGKDIKSYDITECQEWSY